MLLTAKAKADASITAKVKTDASTTAKVKTDASHGESHSQLII
jgi:hypothetical protein